MNKKIILINIFVLTTLFNNCLTLQSNFAMASIKINQPNLEKVIFANKDKKSALKPDKKDKKDKKLEKKESRDNDIVDLNAKANAIDHYNR